MWQCPKCGRSFAKRGQDHYCIEIDTIDRYIEEQAEEVRPLLQRIRATIHEAAPEAQERISWRMPTFWQGKNLIHFAAFKKHIGIYPGDLTEAPFRDRLEKYHHAKGSIRFPIDEDIDLELIAEITRWRRSRLG